MSLYSPRIKEYRFGSLTANTAGNVIGSTAHPIIGELIKIVIDDINTAATGSIFIQSVPIGNYYITHGSVINTASNQEIYFSADQQGTNGNTGVYPVTDDIIFLSGAGFGNGSSVIPILYYR